MINAALLTQLKFKIKKKTETADVLMRKQQQQLINILKKKLNSATFINKILKQNVLVTMYNLLRILLKLQQLFFQELSDTTADEIKNKKINWIKVINLVQISLLKSDCFQSTELKSEMMYAAECLKLSAKIENEFFDTLYNTDAEINIMIKTAVNAVKLFIQSDSMMDLMMYDDENCLFVKMCLNIEVDCREVKCYTSVFVVEKAVYDLLLKRFYQIVIQMKQIKMNDEIC